MDNILGRIGVLLGFIAVLAVSGIIWFSQMDAIKPDSVLYPDVHVYKGAFVLVASIVVGSVMAAFAFKLLRKQEPEAEESA
jgi:hypothetical protein